MAKDKLTIEKSLSDFKRAYQAKRILIERQKDDFLFRLGKQWDAEKEEKLKKMQINPVVDNRIQPNIFLITGLERQNRSDFKAFPEGEEDTIKAEIASALFKNSIKISDFSYKCSEAFEDGITCGESHLELYLDYTYNLLNGKPNWKKIDSNMVFPDPKAKEYDYSDGAYVYKLTTGLTKDDLISLYPEKESKIKKLEGGRLDLNSLTSAEDVHRQPKDYPTSGDGGMDEPDDECFDLLERQYKKWVETYFLGDKKTGEIKEAESKEKAEAFITSYKDELQNEQIQFQQAQGQFQIDQQNYDLTLQQMSLNPNLQDVIPPLSPVAPIPPPEKDLGRFILIKRSVPEIWIFAQVSGMQEPLSDERAWFYPRWKKFGLIPYYAHHSTAPIDGDDRHLLVQGIVYGVKGVQQKHNSAETLKLMHLNSAQNSGWISEENAWVDSKKVESFGSVPGVNLEYKKGYQKPERTFPMPLSQGHTQIANESADAIKSILGINSDLLAAQEGSSQSGRAIALRQKQGLLMVQKLFDNLSRTKQIAGKFLLSQMGEIYDTETAKKVLGEAFLIKNFPPPMIFTGQIDPATGTPQQQAMPDPKTGQPMTYDAELSDLAIAEVLSGDLWQYDVAVGESVASDTMKIANSMELQDLAAKLPGIVPPDVLIEESGISNSSKKKILGRLQQIQSAVPNTLNTPLSVA